MIAKKILQGVLAGLIAINSATLMASEAKTTATQENNVYTEDKLNIVVTPQSPQFVIKLKSNPSTGYSWFLRDYDANVISAVSHTFQRPEQPMPGAPGYEVWTFRVKSTGFTVPQQTLIRFIYARPWEGVNAATQVTYRVSTIDNNK